jgi:hypothetical protein
MICFFDTTVGIWVFTANLVITMRAWCANRIDIGSDFELKVGIRFIGFEKSDHAVYEIIVVAVALKSL